MAKQNCWEFKKCGREQGGYMSAQLGVCPSATEVRLHGTHEGKFAGRACWVVGGTLCGGKEQGTFAQKYHNCEKCDFYRTVRQEEGGKFVLSVVLINKMNSTPTALQKISKSTGLQKTV